MREPEEGSREPCDEEVIGKSWQIQRSFQREPASVHGPQTLRKMLCEPPSPQDLGLWACLELVAPLPLSHPEDCQVYSRGFKKPMRI